MAENGVRGQKVGLSFAVHHQHWQEDLSQTCGFVGKHSVIVSVKCCYGHQQFDSEQPNPCPQFAHHVVGSEHKPPDAYSVMSVVQRCALEEKEMELVREDLLEERILWPNVEG